MVVELRLNQVVARREEARLRFEPLELRPGGQRIALLRQLITLLGGAYRNLVGLDTAAIQFDIQKSPADIQCNLPLGLL